MELLVLLAVLAVISTLGVPQLRDLYDRHRSWSTQHALWTALYGARQHAVMHGMPVVTCGSRNGLACERDAWSDGWLVFESPAGHNNCIVTDNGTHCDHGGRLLAAGSPGGYGIDVIANHNIRTRIRYDRMGRSIFSNGRFTLCSRDGEAISGLVIANSGRLRVARQDEFLDCG